MDENPEVHAAVCSADANNENPFELDSTPSMRVVGVAPKQAVPLQHSSDNTNSLVDVSNGEIPSGPACEADRHGGLEPPSPEVLLSGLTSLTLDQMSGLQIASFAATCAGIQSAECVSSIQDLYMTRDFQGYMNWNEGYLRVAIGDVPYFAANADHLSRIITALLRMKAVVVKPIPIPPRMSYISDLMDRLRTGGQAALADGFIDPLQVIEEILRQPEFIFEKPSYDKYHKSRLPQQPLPGYPPSILPADTFLLIINSFTETYPNMVVGETDYVQKLSIEPDADLRVMGDLHGCAQAFVRMLILLMNEGFIDGGLRLTGQNTYLIFLGDFVDYGRNGCDTLALMMLCRCINPQRVLVCRGNHEDCSIYARPEYGFLLELQSRYGDQTVALRSAIDSSFECMPLAIFAGIKGQPAAGFAQLCHGGLEVDSTTIESFQRLLSSPEDSARCCVSSQSSSRCNLQWGDFSGVAIHGGVASSSRGYTHDIEGAKAAIAKLDVRCVFRGHQDHLHAAKNLVENFKEPVCLVPVELPQHFDTVQIDALKPFAPWLSDHAASLEQLRYQGLRIGALPPFIGPIFTFSNASSCRANYDEGFGMVSMASAWEDCVVRYRIYRPEAFTVRASVFAGSTQYLPDDLARAIDGGGGTESGDAPRTLSWTSVMPAFLNPHFTTIDPDGNALVYVLPKQLQPSSPEGTPTTPSTLSVPENFSRAFLARYHQPDGVTCGMSPRFVEKVLSGDFVRERQEEGRRTEWLKLREAEERLQRKRAAEAEELE